MKKFHVFLIFFLLVAFVIAPAIPALAQLATPPGGGGQEAAVPELPIGTLSLLVAAGAGAIIGGKFFRKKKK